MRSLAALLLLLAFVGCATPPSPARVASPPRALLSRDAAPRPVVAAIDTRGVLGLWRVERTGATTLLARRWLLAEAAFYGYVLRGTDTWRSALRSTPAAAIDLPRRLTVRLGGSADGWVRILVGDRDA